MLCVALQDARDALLGRVFGLAALVRAGLVQDAVAANRVITALLVVAGKKVRHMCTPFTQMMACSAVNDSGMLTCCIV
jgi:hypothetical protein